MTFYAGDEYADDDCTSGPIIDEIDFPDLTQAEFESERQAIEDEYDREQSR
jgi:hypothetical protein